MRHIVRDVRLLDGDVERATVGGGRRACDTWKICCRGDSVPFCFSFVWVYLLLPSVLSYVRVVEVAALCYCEVNL